MIKTLSDKEMLKDFSEEVSKAVNTATELQNDITPIDPIHVTPIKNGHGMKSPHQSLCNVLRREQRTPSLTATDTMDELARNLRSIYSLPNIPSKALDELAECLKKPKPPGPAFASLQLLWCVFSEAFSWSKYFHDTADLDSAHLKGETQDIENHFQAVAALLNSISELPSAQLTKYQETAPMQKFYRDHLIHPLRVAWLMDDFINNWYLIYEQSAKHRLRQTYNSNLFPGQFPSGWPQDISRIGRDQTRLKSSCRAASIAAALFHDMYAGTEGSCSLSEDDLDSFSRPVNPFLEYKFPRRDLEFLLVDGFTQDLGPPFPSHEIVMQAIDQLCETNKSRPAKTEWRDAFTKPKSWEDHGVRSAVELMSLSTEARQAIALHNLFDDCVARIDLMEAPVAFFLVLCDEAQEWGRWVRKKSPDEYSVLTEKCSLEIDQKRFHVTLDFSNVKTDELAFTFNFNKLVNDKKRNLDRLTIPNVKELADLSISYSLKNIDGESTTIFWCWDTKRWEK